MDCCSRSHAVERNNAKDQKKKKKKVGERKSGKGVKLSTDSQSIAARERRHRISERFKILQSLVPGGSKMDTVSMLEEAIHYVKFLKTQIWLHQNMINFSDPNWLLMQNYISGQQQIITCSTDHSYAEPPNMIAEAHALPQLGFPHSGYSSYDEEILMAMAPFDHAKMLH